MAEEKSELLSLVTADELGWVVIDREFHLFLLTRYGARFLRA
ncbi:MAG: hypothetical protein QMD21_07115 [Candidatus Thermoplasmatota archaeon]|nr:hypothetical protein [Candidatus Thermoplasmatota archaeon]